jgi:mitogen-activated protein kinase organizer 1
MGDEVVICGSESGEIFVWDVMQGNVVEKLRQRDGGGEKKEDVVSAVVWCPSRREWASAGGDGSVVVWGDG